jgi:hypothetical protein
MVNVASTILGPIALRTDIDCIRLALLLQNVYVIHES